ncbi:histidinol dehydrogenase [Microbacterium sp. NPDC091382]|uniref:histidinol dehydrogenase n=1 Tax=Microbacterium sp. NPDC091382 TaxID=3364210 RepID=UPI00382C9EED
MNALLARIATWVLAAVIGTVYGVAGTIGQAAVWGVVPVGLLVASIGFVALLVAVRTLTGERTSALACGIGAMLATLVFANEGPGGSVVVPAPPEGAVITPGLIWTFLVPLAAALIVAWPTASRLRSTN